MGKRERTERGRGEGERGKIARYREFNSSVYHRFNGGGREKKGIATTQLKDDNGIRFREEIKVVGPRLLRHFENFAHDSMINTTRETRSNDACRLR